MGAALFLAGGKLSCPNFSVVVRLVTTSPSIDCALLFLEISLVWLLLDRDGGGGGGGSRVALLTRGGGGGGGGAPLDPTRPGGGGPRGISGGGTRSGVGGGTRSGVGGGGMYSGVGGTITDDTLGGAFDIVTAGAAAYTTGAVDLLAGPDKPSPLSGGGGGAGCERAWDALSAAVSTFGASPSVSGPFDWFPKATSFTKLIRKRATEVEVMMLFVAADPFPADSPAFSSSGTGITLSSYISIIWKHVSIRAERV